MAFTIESKFPPEENFRHFDAITSAPYKVDDRYLAGAKDLDLIEEQRALFEAFVRSFEGNENTKMSAKFKYENLAGLKSFRGNTFHLDSFAFKNFTSIATSTTAEIAQGTIEYFRKTAFSPVNSNSVDAHLEEIDEIDDTLLRLANEFGYYWLEEAGGLMPASDEKLERMSRVVKVSNLVVAQVMPCVAMTGELDAVLHRSSKWHPSQAPVRGTGRAFTDLLVPVAA